MSRNEKICGVMKWNYKLPETKHRFLSDTIGIAKLLQQRMVDDGWCVQITHYGGSHFNGAAWNVCGEPHEYRILNLESEPAAIVELFVKVYSLD